MPSILERLGELHVDDDGKQWVHFSWIGSESAGKPLCGLLRIAALQRSPSQKFQQS
jgi:hypothetical protein